MGRLVMVGVTILANLERTGNGCAPRVGILHLRCSKFAFIRPRLKSAPFTYEVFAGLGRTGNGCGVTRKSNIVGASGARSEVAIMVKTFAHMTLNVV